MNSFSFFSSFLLTPFLVFFIELSYYGIYFTCSFTLLGLTSKFFVDLPSEVVLPLRDRSSWPFSYFLLLWLLRSVDFVYYLTLLEPGAALVEGVFFAGTCLGLELFLLSFLSNLGEPWPDRPEAGWCCWTGSGWAVLVWLEAWQPIFWRSNKIILNSFLLSKTKPYKFASKCVDILNLKIKFIFTRYYYFFHRSIIFSYNAELIACSGSSTRRVRFRRGRARVVGRTLRQGILLGEIQDDSSKNWQNSTLVAHADHYRMVFCRRIRESNLSSQENQQNQARTLHWVICCAWWGRLSVVLLLQGDGGDG